MPIRAVLFDRDGVLVKVDWRGIHHALISKLPILPEEIDRRWQSWVERGGAGAKEGDPEAIGVFLRSLADELTDPVARDALEQFQLAQFVWAFPDARPALDMARQTGLCIGVLSNNTILLGSRALLVLVGLDDLVDVVLTSQSMGVSKPHAMAYRIAAEALDVSLDECLFFDDNADWCAAARALGIHAYHVDRPRVEDDFAGGVVRDLSAVGDLIASFNPRRPGP
jgi:HAD superfamily hydrolase (TIGR01509 family)